MTSRLHIFALAALFFSNACAEEKGSIKGPSKENEYQFPDQPYTPADIVQSLDAVIGECGAERKELENPSFKILERKMNGWPIIFTGTFTVSLEPAPFPYTARIYTDLNVTLTPGEAKIDITNLDPDFEPEDAADEATEKMEEIEKVIGSYKGLPLTLKEREKLSNENQQWAGIYCGLVAIKSITTTIGEGSKKVEFDPALPFFINPKASINRIEQEIGGGKTFNVEANSKGKKTEGTVTVSKIDPNLVISVSGSTGSIPSNAAYSFQFNFESESDTVDLGLPKKMDIYINTEDQGLRAAIIDSGVTDEVKTLAFSTEFTR